MSRRGKYLIFRIGISVGVGLKSLRYVQVLSAVAASGTLEMSEGVLMESNRGRSSKLSAQESTLDL